ncbi:hypothetical protein VKT23_005268 [Stygiomarasmius scandens]|uniref:Uncharacterized protein n=1 Tax=Marasmiellus scandens TaxID=2682957 RepID=A0ABR1JRS7_9AGAR
MSNFGAAQAQRFPEKLTGANYRYKGADPKSTTVDDGSTRKHGRQNSKKHQLALELIGTLRNTVSSRPGPMNNTALRSKATSPSGITLDMLFGEMKKMADVSMT